MNVQFYHVKIFFINVYTVSYWTVVISYNPCSSLRDFLKSLKCYINNYSKINIKIEENFFLECTLHIYFTFNSIKPIQIYFK